jgi:hypothetical protein
MAPTFEISRPELRGVVEEVLDDAEVSVGLGYRPLDANTAERIRIVVESAKKLAFGMGSAVTEDGERCLCPALAADVYRSDISGSFPLVFDTRMRERFGDAPGILKIIDGHPRMTV